MVNRAGEEAPVTRVRGTHVALLAVAAAAIGPAGVAQAAPPVPPPPTAGSGNTTTAPQTGSGGQPHASVPTPAAVTSLVVTNRPGAIVVRWDVPSASITGVIVRRGVGGRCPARSDAGVGVGGSALRSSQVDSQVQPGARYCYTVFAEGRHGVASATRTALASPPPRVTKVTAVAASDRISLSWNPSPGATAYVVRAGPSCPNAITAGRAVARTTHRVATDRSAVPGTSSCYSVFALDRFDTHLSAARSNDVVAPVPSSPTPPIVSSSLANVVGAIALGVLLLTVMAFLVVRQINRGDDWHYGQTPRGGRMAIGGHATAALVIPVAIAVVGLVLIIAAALSV